MFLSKLSYNELDFIAVQIAPHVLIASLDKKQAHVSSLASVSAKTPRQGKLVRYTTLRYTTVPQA